MQFKVVQIVHFLLKSVLRWSKEESAIKFTKQKSEGNAEEN